MTDDKIIKALNCCQNSERCDDCPYSHLRGQNTLCIDTSQADYLDLINRQKAEIEELQKRIVFWREDMDYRPNEIRAEAIKEFAERLKERASNKFWDGNRMHELKVPLVGVDEIDNLVKK